MYLNEVKIIGNITNDLELKALPSGIKVLQFSVATNKKFKDKNGDKKETTEFHNVVSFGKQAETIAQYMQKGNQIFITGELQTRSWEDKDTGKKMYKTEIFLNQFQFGNNNKTNPKDEYRNQPIGDVSNGNDIDNMNYPDDDINPEDIPF